MPSARPSRLALASDIEELAVKLIKEEGAEGSFNKVPGYSWVTCISVNEGWFMEFREH